MSGIAPASYNNRPDPAAFEAAMDPTFFETPEDFRPWLAENHATADHLWVGFYKKGSGRPSLTEARTAPHQLRRLD